MLSSVRVRSLVLLTVAACSLACECEVKRAFVLVAATCTARHPSSVPDWTTAGQVVFDMSTLFAHTSTSNIS